MKIVVAGNYGAGNIGDEMILQGLLASFSAIVLMAEFTVLSGNPEQTKLEHGVKSELKVPAGLRSLIFSKKGNTMKAIKRCDYFVLGGGGLFGSLSTRANLIWAMQAMAALRYKKPLICYGQSIGKITNPVIKILIKKIFNAAIFITVRDNKSKENLQSLGIKKEIHVAPDLAFRTNIQPFSQKSNTAAVALRQLQHLPHNFESTISTFLKWLNKEQNKKIEFINFQEGGEADHILHEKIQKAIPGNTITELKFFLKADFILGMRLHSIITAIKAQTPFIAINYASKVRSFLEYADLTDYLLEFDELTFENLKNLYLKIQSEKPAIIEKLKTFNQKALKRHQEIEMILTSTLL